MKNAENPGEVERLCSAFNFGPTLQSNRTVGELVDAMTQHWRGSWVDQSDPNAPHEATNLHLVADKAYRLLDWQPLWDFDTTTGATADWYRNVSEGQNAHTITLDQISEFERALG